MLQKFLFLLSLAVWTFASCNNANTPENDQDQGMAQFADDQEFQDAHETPDSIGYQALGKRTRFPTPDGQQGSAYALYSEKETNQFLFVIHEWWGLNDHIKQEADRLFQELENVHVLALDLYDGNVADTQEKAGEFMSKAQQNQGRLEAIIQGAIASAGPEARIGTIGWCFGGGWSLRASILAGDQAAGCVIYYGMPVENAKDLAPLQAEMLGIFARQDNWINEEVVGNFENLAKATGKKLDVHWFDAQHAFANPSSPRYDEPAAREANQLALEFLKAHL